MLPINEIFETIQGEACKAGTPSVFVRLQACPVRCPWCDTKHTWFVDLERRVSIADMMIKTEDTHTWAMMSPEDALLAVQAFSARHVVIAGGEPALYDLRPLTTLLVGSGFSVQLETSGTQAIQANPYTWVTVSPKVGMPVGGPFWLKPCGVPMRSNVQNLLSRPIDQRSSQRYGYNV